MAESEKLGTYEQGRPTVKRVLEQGGGRGIPPSH